MFGLKPFKEKIVIYIKQRGAETHIFTLFNIPTFQQVFILERVIIIRCLTITIKKKVNVIGLESEYDSDDDWDEVYGKDDVDNYVELIMAGGGSHAWSYIINKETEKYYIKRYDEDLDLMIGKTLLWRQEQRGGSQYVKEINKTDEIPEDNDEWFYFMPEY